MNKNDLPKLLQRKQAGRKKIEYWNQEVTKMLSNRYTLTHIPDSQDKGVIIAKKKGMEQRA